MISCAAAVGMRCVKPSSATESPSRTSSATASRRSVTLANRWPLSRVRPSTGPQDRLERAAALGVFGGPVDLVQVVVPDQALAREPAPGGQFFGRGGEEA